MNQVTLLGNLARDPELRNIASGSAVCNFTVAVNRKWTEKGGEKKEEVSFIDCQAWGKTAETISQYFGKGKPIIVVGRLKQSTWEKDGQKHSKIGVVVESFHFLPAAKSQVDDTGDGNSIPVRSQTRAAAPPRRGP